MVEFCAQAPVAQVDRVSDYGSEGWRFESSRAHHHRAAGPSDPRVRPSLMRSRTLVILVLLAAFAAYTERTSAPEVLFGTALVGESSGHRVFGGNTPGVVDLVTSEVFVAREAVTLTDASPQVIDEGLELVAARVVFLRRSEGTHRALKGGTPLFICTNRWPPAGWGPSYPVPQLEIHAGDRFAVLFYLRPRSAEGSWSSSGVRVIYEAGSQRYYQETQAVEVDIDRARTRRDLPRGVPVCDADAWAKTDWFEELPGFPDLDPA